MTNSSWPSTRHELVHELLVVGGHGAGPGPNRLAGQIQVLADVPGVQGNDLVGGQPVAPFHAIGDGRPNEDRGGPAGEGLAEGGLRQFFRHLLLSEQVQQLMLQRQVTIEARLQTAHPQHGQVGFQRVPVAGGRDRAQHGPRADLLPHALGRPEQERQFVQPERPGGKAAVTATVADGGRHVHRLYTCPLPHRRQIVTLCIRREGFFQRRQGDAPALIRRGEIDLLADRVPEKLPVSVQLAFGHDGNSNMGQRSRLCASMIPCHAWNTSSPRAALHSLPPPEA